MHNGLLNSFGLDFLDEDEKTLQGFIFNALQNGNMSKTYYGSKHLNYYYKFLNKDGSLGGDTLQIICNLEKTDDGRLDLGSFDIHHTGKNVWDVEILEECKDEEKRYTGQRQIISRTVNGKGGLTVINVINPDILPSYLSGDVIRLQMKAIALDIDYFRTEDEFLNSFNSEYKIGVGTVLSSQFVYNHQLSPDGKKLDRQINYEENDYTLVRGKVKKIYVYPVGYEENGQLCTFLNAIVETQYGDLEIVHSLKQIKEDQKNNLFEGAEVFALCVLQGDALLIDKDITLNRENNIRALNFALNSGETSRIASIIVDDVDYFSESNNTIKKGKQDLIDYLYYVYNNQHNVKRYIVFDDEIKEEVINIDYDDLSPQRMRITCNENGLISKILVQERNKKGK